MPAVHAGKLQIRVGRKWEKVKRENKTEGKEGGRREGMERKEDVTAIQRRR